MYTVGEQVKWMSPLDEDYSYGTIKEIKGRTAMVACSGYYAGVIARIPLKYIKKIEKGGKGFGSSKKHSKRSTP